MISSGAVSESRLYAIHSTRRWSDRTKSGRPPDEGPFDNQHGGGLPRLFAGVRQRQCPIAWWISLLYLLQLLRLIRIKPVPGVAGQAGGRGPRLFAATRTRRSPATEGTGAAVSLLQFWRRSGNRIADAALCGRRIRLPDPARERSELHWVASSLLQFCDESPRRPSAATGGLIARAKRAPLL